VPPHAPAPAQAPQAHRAPPGYAELQAASANYGASLLRSAKGIFDQGKRGYYGDGSPLGFMRVVFDQARLPIPEPGAEWGQVIFEQDASSVLKRLDEPRPGDLAAFHDARLKGKKGISSYTQQVGSVQDPLLGIIAEVDQKKRKIRVLQVERGHPDEVSYRLDDLKSGRVMVSRVQGD